MALDSIINREDSSWWQQLLRAPYRTLATKLYAHRQHVILKQQPLTGTARELAVVCISDTHNAQPDLPPGHLLIHAGDLTQNGTARELQAQLTWLDAQPHPHKVVIAGNHDIVLDRVKSAEFGLSPFDRQSLEWGSITYLERSATTVETSAGGDLILYGHPSTRKHGNWAFQYQKGTNVFARHVPDATDILVTHSAPRFHLDVAGWGDEFLLEELWRVKPRLHVFGHIHAGFGRDTLVYDQFEILYESLCAGSAGILALLHMALLLLVTLLLGEKENVKRTTLINASAVGGLLDRNIREAQVVYV